MNATATAAPTNRIKTHLPPEFSAPPPGPQPLATFLGLFSIGLGLAEVVAPRSLGRLTGVRYPALLRAYGVREIAAGVGILANDRPATWLAARVAGDALDLATIGAAYAEARGTDKQRVLLTAAAVAGVTALDVICAQDHVRHD